MSGVVCVAGSPTGSDDLARQLRATRHGISPNAVTAACPISY